MIGIDTNRIHRVAGDEQSARVAGVEQSEPPANRQLGPNAVFSVAHRRTHFRWGLTIVRPQLPARSTIVLAAVLAFAVGGNLAVAIGQQIHPSVPPAWLPEVDDILFAQNFPSCAAAGSAVGGHLRDTVGEEIHLADGIAVVATDEHASEQTLGAVRSSLAAEFPGTPIRVASAWDSIGDGEIIVAVRNDVEATVLHASVQSKAKPKQGYGRISLDYDEKPWVTSDAELADSERVVQSLRLADSRRDARQQCLDHALEILSPIFDEHARNVYQDRPEVPFDTREAIRVALKNGHFTVDEFTQLLRTADGTDAWRHAMLLTDTAMNELMVNMNVKAHAQRNARHWRWLSRFGGLVALLICVAILYLVLDAATKGYYAGRISAVIAVFGIVALILIYFRTMG